MCVINTSYTHHGSQADQAAAHLRRRAGGHGAAAAAHGKDDLLGQGRTLLLKGIRPGLKCVQVKHL